MSRGYSLRRKTWRREAITSLARPPETTPPGSRTSLRLGSRAEAGRKVGARRVEPLVESSGFLEAERQEQGSGRRAVSERRDRGWGVPALKTLDS